jgi:hypothetical protein
MLGSDVLFKPRHRYRLTRGGQDYQSFFSAILQNPLGPAATKRTPWHGVEFMYRRLFGQSVNRVGTQKPRVNIYLSADYEARPFGDLHTIFERVRIRSRDGTVASAMSRKRNGKSNVASQTPDRLHK